MNAQPEVSEVSTPSSGAPLDPVGRAKRFVCDEGELWIFSAADERLASRLARLGRANVGGFSTSGQDERGAWVVRRVALRRLDGLARGEKLAWKTALALVRSVAVGLAACEKSALFPGPLRQSDVVLEPDIFLAADALVRAICGEVGEPAHASTAPSPKWTPPEQAAGAPWDNAANRYVLGLIAYRAIAGKHPFGGGGLRHALSAQASAEAPPFDDELRLTLLPGVQSFVLKLIDPRASRRPSSASEIVKICSELLADSPEEGGEIVAPRRSEPEVARAKEISPREVLAKKRSSPRAEPPSWQRVVPLGLGIVVAVAALAAGAREEAPVKPAIASLRPLRTTTAADCAPCHAREVAEWERSVMAHAAKSPLYGSLESVVEEQVGRDARCPNGAGVLRKAGVEVCRNEQTGIAETGAGGELWCVNCHAPGENLNPGMPAWSAFGSRDGRAPVRDLLSPSSMEGISCAGCHTTIGPVGAHASRAGTGYEGNPSWISAQSGSVFLARPEDLQGRSGIANSGYQLDPRAFLTSTLGTRVGDPPVHKRPTREASRYLASSEFCGACHDVRLFGTDAIGGRDRGEHFKRLRNAYSEWRAWATDEERGGRTPATCQGCHMSLYPGVCAPGTKGKIGDCPDGTHFEAKAAGDFGTPRQISHYFTSVDVPLTDSYPEAFASDRTLDGSGLPVGLRQRRDMLLRKAFRFELGDVRVAGGRLEVPVRIENTGAGHRVPAGFSQEREIWVELTVTDARGQLVYEVGKIATDDADLKDKIFLRVNTSDGAVDFKGRPLGVFGADIADGPDVPAWSPNPARGGTTFRGRGLINFQNGFLRCVRCIGTIDDSGACQAGPGQGRTRADRFDDGAYDIESGECRSNLSGGNEFFETYFPVGALDADRGIAKAPDAIVDLRSAPPNVPILYTYDLDTRARQAPFHVEAKLRFRSFPPFLVKAFADYEARKDAARARPSGPQVVPTMLRRIDVIDLASVDVRTP
jgi:hypothetical protein